LNDAKERLAARLARLKGPDYTVRAAFALPRRQQLGIHKEKFTANSRQTMTGAALFSRMS